MAKDASLPKPREALARLPPNPGTRSNYAGSVNFGLAEINFLLEFNKEIVIKHPFLVIVFIFIYALLTVHYFHFCF